MSKKILFPQIKGLLHGSDYNPDQWLDRPDILEKDIELMKIRFQKFFSIFLTSLLFSLMHMPFGFYFMMSAFLLSMALGYVYERHQNLWGCVFLHWCCGYLAMCLYF